jgi:hypothetical protein
MVAKNEKIRLPPKKTDIQYLGNVVFLKPNGISSITVEIVFKTIRKYKNITKINSRKPNSLNCKIKKK